MKCKPEYSRPRLSHFVVKRYNLRKATAQQACALKHAPSRAHNRNTKYSWINYSVQTRAENWARVCFFVFKAWINYLKKLKHVFSGTGSGLKRHLKFTSCKNRVQERHNILNNTFLNSDKMANFWKGVYETGGPKLIDVKFPTPKTKHK